MAASNSSEKGSVSCIRWQTSKTIFASLLNGKERKKLIIDYYYKHHYFCIFLNIFNAVERT